MIVELLVQGEKQFAFVENMTLAEAREELENCYIKIVKVVTRKDINYEEFMDNYYKKQGALDD